MEGRNVLVTGGTGGIGRETARQLLSQGARVWIVGRDAGRTAEAAADLASNGGEIQGTFLADLSCRADILRLSEEVHARLDHLDVLVNNAGAVFTRRHTSCDGYEMTFALNHLSYFMLTRLLLDILQAGRRPRIVNVSSSAHWGGRLNFSDLQMERVYSSFRAYSNSKLMNVLFTYELANRLKGNGITANALHPGFVATNFGKSNGGLSRPVFAASQVFAIPPSEGARTSVYLASSPAVEGVTGQYFARCKPVRSSPLSYQGALAGHLWEVTETLAA